MYTFFQTNLSFKVGPFYLGPASNYFYNLEQTWFIFTRKKNVSNAKMHRSASAIRVSHILRHTHYTREDLIHYCW